MRQLLPSVAPGGAYLRQHKTQTPDLTLHFFSIGYMIVIVQEEDVVKHCTDHEFQPHSEK